MMGGGRRVSRAEGSQCAGFTTTLVISSSFKLYTPSMVSSLKKPMGKWNGPSPSAHGVIKGCAIDLFVHPTE